MKSIILLLAGALFLTSCAQQSLTGDTYSRGEVGGQNEQRGKVTSVRKVVIEGNTQSGKLLGAVAGGFLGSEVGSGSGRTAATVGGALLGGAAGSHVGKAAGTKQGVEISVKLDNGRRVSVVQEYNPREPFRVGERVRVLSHGGRTRVTH